MVKKLVFLFLIFLDLLLVLHFSCISFTYYDQVYHPIANPQNASYWALSGLKGLFSSLYVQMYMDIH